MQLLKKDRQRGAADVFETYFAESTEILMTRNFGRSWTEGHLRRTTRYVERKARGVNRRVAGLQIGHLLEIGIVGTRRHVVRASTTADVIADPILNLKILIFVWRNPGCG